MNIAFYFKNFEPSPGLREYAAKRFDKLAKYMPNADNAEVVVTLLVEKTRQIADVVIDADAMHISAHERSDDMYSTIDMITDKLEAQVRKMREKMKDRRKAASSDVTMGVVSFTDEGKVHSIEESDKYSPKPMSVEEAAEQITAMKYEFLVFFNSEAERINVIYKRKNGDFGLIDPGVSL
ncbi:ribosome hibernation-promoting factor, HPF/YfiA family [Fundidesulfovibrio terrae]|uniref:ribosome hibernation-promoting factor, HPF/YfiA family n=1 Tax=Fundidesulfovibrio terrae TaxID=2922866 RepID=UPI001FAF8D06|nr:ribosome-associated translation inhibitor RaiA [Fundidesulfovibrio terrae]